VEINARNQSIAEIRSKNNKLVWAAVVQGVVSLLLAIKLVTQSEIIINQTPGMPNNAVIEKSVMDKGAQKATLSTLTSAIAQTNPVNAEFNKEFIQAFLSPSAYTRVSRAIDDQVARLTAQHELGSYYFVQRAYEYDPGTNKHFVQGDVHTVNAARDTAQPYVFEYSVHVENYRLVVDEVTSYQGDRVHDAEWLRSNKK
jgi:conjugal transfer pilus assembly protein TraE